MIFVEPALLHRRLCSRSKRPLEHIFPLLVTLRNDQLTLSRQRPVALIHGASARVDVGLEGLLCGHLAGSLSRGIENPDASVVAVPGKGSRRRRILVLVANVLLACVLQGQVNLATLAEALSDV